MNVHRNHQQMPKINGPAQLCGLFLSQTGHLKKTMATAKKTKSIAPAKKGVSAKKSSGANAPAKSATRASASGLPNGKPIKTAFNKSSLMTYLANDAGVEIKSVRAVVASLEGAMLASVSKKGLGSFTLPGLLKVSVINVPAKKKRTGIDPFTKVEREFAAKPASVNIKTRALKKLKDAAA